MTASLLETVCVSSCETLRRCIVEPVTSVSPVNEMFSPGDDRSLQDRRELCQTGWHGDRSWREPAFKQKGERRKEMRRKKKRMMSEGGGKECMDGVEGKRK